MEGYVRGDKVLLLDDIELNGVQRAAVELMKADLRFLYTGIVNQNQVTPSYYIYFMPFTGLIIDGVEDWIKSYNNSSKAKIDMPLFSEQEQEFFEEMRNSIKFFDNGYEYAFKRLEEEYEKSKIYFSSVCKPFAKAIHLYDIFGVYTANGITCGNTIFAGYSTPWFELGGSGEYIRDFLVIAGKYIRMLGAVDAYPVDETYLFDTRDYGGFVKSPVGNKFSYKFVLFSILCQINFVMVCINGYVSSAYTTKLRLSYVQYYYTVSILSEISSMNGLDFRINTNYVNEKFRNAMAHYKLGIALSPEEIQPNKAFYGLVEKYFNMECRGLLDLLIKEMENLGKQISDYLRLKDTRFK